tara:strand:+ start:1880 stop:4048 length:2169 start_codon:yes stop_codon:yes gene_type:complete
MAIPTQEVVTQWSLDPTKFKKEIGESIRDIKQAEMAEKRLDQIQGRLNGSFDKFGKKLKNTSTGLKKTQLSVKGLTKSNTGLIKSLSSVGTVAKAAFIGITGAIVGASAAFIGLIDRGTKMQDLWRANTIGIDEARTQVKGFISDQQLLVAANKAATFELGLSEKQFAALSKGAVVASKKIGGDVPKAIDDLITGMSRQSKMILDNLGILVSVEKANEAYAKSLGKTAKELTDVERKQAFTNAAIADLQRIAGDAEIEVGDLGTAYASLKTATDNALGAVARFLASLTTGSPTLSAFVSKLNNAADAMNKMSDPRKRQLLKINSELAAMTPTIQKLNKEIDFTRRQFRPGKEPFFQPKAQLAQALSFYNKYTAKQREFTNLRVAGEKEAQKKIHDAFMAGQQKIAAAEVARFEAQEAARARAAAKALKARARSAESAKATSFQIPRTKGLEIGGLTGTEIGINKITAAMRKAVAASKGIPKGIQLPIVGDFDDEKAARLNSMVEKFESLRRTLGQMSADGLQNSGIFKTLAADLGSLGTKINTEAGALSEFRKSVNETSADIVDMGVNAFAQFGASIISAADAAISGSESFGAAVAKSLKSTLLAVATEAAVMSLMALAKYAMSGFTDPSALSAALMYGAVAVVAGGAGLGISAAIGGDSASSGSTKPTTSTAQSKQFGQTVEDKRPVNINVFLRDTFDPSAARVKQRNVTTSISRAQTVTS